MEFISKGFVEDTLLPDGPTTGAGGVQANFEDKAIGAMVGGMGRAQDNTLATAKIRALEFTVLRNNDVLRMSQVQVVNRSFYEEGNKMEPTPWGVLDRRMGTSRNDPKFSCTTCGKKLEDCVGHYGHIQLELPVFHTGYYKEITRVLQSICKTCARVLLLPDEAARLGKNMRNPTLDRRTKGNIHKYILAQVKKRRKCGYCGAHNGVIKKMAASFKMIHELRHKEALEDRDEFEEEFNTAAQFNPLIEELLGKVSQDLSPLACLHLFKRVLDAECVLLNLRGRPEDMIVQTLLVPPPCIRPSVTMGASGSNEDDLTVKLGDVIFLNKMIARSIQMGASTSKIYENWDVLQSQVAMYVNAENVPGIPKGGKTIRGLSQRLKGKEGRFRGNLSGKRVDFSGRTVISPDPNLRVDQVGIPWRVAIVLTYPERVTESNIHVMRQAVINGPFIHPGATAVQPGSGVGTFNLKPGGYELLPAKRIEVANKLRYGDVVLRHLRDEDMVLFNRQPSLHKMSIMCHRAKILEWRTFRFNECACTPYNADFDGDEMNIHVPQTEEARAEALNLMGIQENLVTPRHGEPLVAATQDFLTTAYLITQRDVFYDRAQFCHICTYLNHGVENMVIPPPAILKPMMLWTGKQVIGMLLHPNNDGEWPLVNLELKERHFEAPKGAPLYMCPRDGYVVFRNSELVCGSLGKSTLGGSKSGLYYCLIRDHSQYLSATCMNRLARLSSRWIGTRGFSIGIDDVTPTQRLVKLKKDVIQDGYEFCYDKIKQWKMGKLEPASGMNETQTLEAVCLGKLSEKRDDLGGVCLKELDPNFNAPWIMAVCGSKGSKINISQMVSCVGQQAVSGHRIPDGFVNRSLPHFAKFSREPEAKGFVQNSFFSGLTATEFFFHTMGGREGLVDTAVKTAETGYMQRRLMKALEDLCVSYDRTVRTAEQGVVQFIYGDDGLDPVMMVDGIKPVIFTRVWEHVRAVNPYYHEKDMHPLAMENLVNQVKPKDFGPCSDQFVASMKAFVKERADELLLLMQSLKLTGDGKNAVAGGAHVTRLTCRVTVSQLKDFIELCRKKFTRAEIEPGTAVGALCAQSIGEPGTQMTLKTFHFAGVASMNVTLGVPRIKEIINAAKTIASPIMTVPLVNDSSITAARIVKGRLEKTTLGDIAEYIEEVYSSGQCYLSVKLDLHAIKALQLGINAETVGEAIRQHKKLRVKDGVKPKGEDLIRIYMPKEQVAKNSLLFTMQQVKTMLPKVIVKGLPTVNRAVINEKSKGKYNILVEGADLRRVMGVTGVDGRNATSNHVLEVEKVLGIEAARATIAKEITSTMDGHGLTVDPRHIALLADIMSYRGEILGINRFGVAKMKESVLMLASFERTTDHLFEAALRGASDEVKGVSECIIMGTPIPIGTGLFSLLQKATPPSTTVRDLMPTNKLWWGTSSEPRLKL